MKNNKLIILLIIILLSFVVGLTLIMVNLICGNKFFKFRFNNKISNEIVFNETFNQSFENININTNASDIFIKQSSEQSIKIIIYGDKEDTSVTNNNDELSINSKGKFCIGFCFNQTISKVEVFIPINFSNNIKIDNKYGDITIDKFLDSSLKINADCGDINIKGASKINAKNSYGDIKIEQVNDAEIELDAGDLNIDTVNNLIVHNKYGDIDIDNANNYLKITEDCGDVNIKNINLNQDSSIKNSFGDIEIGSTNNLYIEASTDLGDTKINKNQRKAKTTLKLENSCGDIKVKN